MSQQEDDGNTVFHLERSHDEGNSWNKIFSSNCKGAVIAKFNDTKEKHLPIRVINDKGRVIAYN